jgi:hypothetical protein
MNYGTLELQLKNDSSGKIALRKAKESGGFGASIWKRMKDLLYPINTSEHELYNIPLFLEKKEGLTGIWKSIDGGKYFLHQIDEKIVWWFGISNAANFANVFRGEIKQDSIYGEWADVALPRTKNKMRNGNLRVKICNGINNIEYLKMKNMYGLNKKRLSTSKALKGYWFLSIAAYPLI